MLSLQVMLPVFCCVQAYNLDTHFPIIYKDPAKRVSQTKSSYFGYSVGMHSQPTENNTKFWIGVGAPRATAFGVKESGALYKCLQGNKCNEVQLGTADKEKLLLTDTHKYIEVNESAWIGVAMATGGAPASEAYTVICGHRWIDKLRRLDFIPGVCYWKTEAEEVYTKALPLANNVSYITQTKNGSSYKLGVGQAGVAVHILTLQQGAEILIGAPGVDMWFGSVISYVPYVEKSKLKWRTIIAEARKSKLEKFEYFGYAVSSGKLSSKYGVLHIAGGPRGAELKGHVLIFEYEKRCKTSSYDQCRLRVVEEKRGETIGEYFGAALAVADINGDELDDLIVGAPLYTRDYCDQGKVQVFLAAKQPKGSLFSKEILLLGKADYGRFGTSIASLGDIDRDGCEDIAIGAPYENEQGAIYVYYGSRANEFREERRIAAEELNNIIKPNPSLKGFGISIAKPEDIDGNGFKDVTVGSFLSGHAVVLRAYKVINITAKITPSVDILQTSDTELNVTACVSYSGMYAPASVVVNRTVIVDRVHKRFYMRNNKAVYTRLVNITGVHLCEKITLYAKNKQRVEKHDEILVELDVEMQDIREVPGKVFCHDCPVLNKFQSTLKAKAVVNFFLDCGIDNKCQSELKASYNLEGLKENQTFVVGSEENPKLSINMCNAGDPSYNTEVKVVIPSPLKWAVKPENCETEISVRHLICEVGNPLTAGKPAVIEIPLDMSEVVWQSEPLVFNFSLLYSNRSKNLNTEQEQQRLELHLKNDACVGLTGKSEEIYNLNATREYIDFEHKHEIYKYGESPVQDIDVHFDIPFLWREAKRDTIKFLDFDIQVNIQNGMPPLCYLNGVLLTQNEETDEPTEKEDDETESLIRLKRDVTGNEMQDDLYSSLYANRTLILSCSNPNVTCNTVHCKISAFPSGRQEAATIDLKMKLYVNQLGVVMNKKDIISVATNASVTYRKQNELTCNHPVIVQSVFPLSIKKAALETWVIGLSIIAGILIFMLLVIGLIKAGFFRRKKKEELMEKKRASVPVFITGGIQYTEDAEFMEIEGNEEQLST